MNIITNDHHRNVMADLMMPGAFIRVPPFFQGPAGRGCRVSCGPVRSGPVAGSVWFRRGRQEFMFKAEIPRIELFWEHIFWSGSIAYSGLQGVSVHAAYCIKAAV